MEDGPGLNMSWPPGLEGGGLVFLRSERGGLFMKELREGMLASLGGSASWDLAACGALTFGCFAADA